MAKKEKRPKRSEGAPEIEKELSQLGLSDTRASAIVKRYGPSRQKCFEAASMYLTIKKLGVGQ